MTNIEFLVNELRKANEKIDSLNKEIARLKTGMAMSRKATTSSYLLSDVDALAALKKRMEEI